MLIPQTQKDVRTLSLLRLLTLVDITKKNDVRYFNFPRNMDDFAICNKLWDMLGQEA